MLDHVVAVINGSVILESDVQEEIRYGVLQPFSVNPARNTPQRALQRLIDRALICATDAGDAVRHVPDAGGSTTDASRSCAR